MAADSMGKGNAETGEPCSLDFVRSSNYGLAQYASSVIIRYIALRSVREKNKTTLRVVDGSENRAKAWNDLRTGEHLMLAFSDEWSQVCSTLYCYWTLGRDSSIGVKNLQQNDNASVQKKC